MIKILFVGTCAHVPTKRILRRLGGLGFVVWSRLFMIQMLLPKSMNCADRGHVTCECQQHLVTQNPERDTQASKTQSKTRHTCRLAMQTVR